MKRAEFLQTVRKEIHYIFARNAIEKELEQHINESIEDMIADGMYFDEAEELAVLQMGDAKEIGHELNKVHNPLMGYLIMFTRCMIVLMLLPILFDLKSVVYSVSYMFFPLERTEYEQKQELDVILETPVHYVKFDDLYFLEDEECVITYRTYQRIWKNRTRNSFSYKVLDENGEYILSSSSGTIAGITSINELWFEKDGMSSIFIHSEDGQVLEISLEEGSYEAK